MHGSKLETWPRPTCSGVTKPNNSDLQKYEKVSPSIPFTVYYLTILGPRSAAPTPPLIYAGGMNVVLSAVFAADVNLCGIVVCWQTELCWFLVRRQAVWCSSSSGDNGSRRSPQQGVVVAWRVCERSENEIYRHVRNRPIRQCNRYRRRDVLSSFNQTDNDASGCIESKLSDELQNIVVVNRISFTWTASVFRDQPSAT